MFLIGEYPEYNPLNSDKKEVTVTSDEVINAETKKADEHMGEE